MSNALAIAATTLTLRTILDAVATADYSALPAGTRPVSTIDVSTLPPDQAAGDSTRNRVNLFLYATEYNAAWRNTDLPRQGRPGDAQPPVLPLDLHYLVTVYPENDNELIGQVLLGTAMRILHDHPVLARSEIALALAELDTQAEAVRITAEPFRPEELSALWTGFQSDFRLSAGYRVGVILIESARAGRAALPVLRRGSADRGPAIVAGRAPSLRAVAGFYDPAVADRPSGSLPSAELGQVVVLSGSNFDGAEMTALLTHDRSGSVHEVALLIERDDATVRVPLPPVTDPSVARDWPAGFWAVELRVTRPDAPPWTTNRLTFALAPVVASLAPPTQGVGSQPFALTLEVRPQVLADQRAAVLLGDREFRPDAGGIITPGDPDAASTVTVTVDGLAAGPHVARLRLDGIDSLPVDFSASPPAFDPAQTLVVTP